MSIVFGEWTDPHLHERCPRFKAGEDCVKPCCKRNLTGDEKRWRRLPGLNGQGNIEVSPEVALEAAHTGYVRMNGVEYPAHLEDPRDPNILRVYFGGDRGKVTPSWAK